MINFEPKYNWIYSLIILFIVPHCNFMGSVKHNFFYKCKFLNLSICKIITKVANLLKYTGCVWIIDVMKTKQNKWYFSIPNSTWNNFSINFFCPKQCLISWLYRWCHDISNNQKNHCAALWFMFSFQIFF